MTNTRAPLRGVTAVSDRSRLPFPRERRPGALNLFLNQLNYQLIYAPGFTAPQCPRGAAVRKFSRRLLLACHLAFARMLRVRE